MGYRMPELEEVALLKRQVIFRDKDLFQTTYLISNRIVTRTHSDLVPLLPSVCYYCFVFNDTPRHRLWLIG